MRGVSIALWNWLEGKAVLFGLLVYALSGGVVTLTVLLKLLVKPDPPLLFDLRQPRLTEVEYILPMFLVLGWSLLYSSLYAGITGERMRSSMHTLVCLPTVVLASLLMALWWWTGPDPRATYTPLMALILYSGFCTWWFVFRLREATKRVRAPHAGGTNPSNEEPAEPAAVTHPHRTLASIYGNDSAKARLRLAAAEIAAPRTAGEAPRNGILLHGLPGNGKTAFAEALAGELKRPLVSLSYSDVASQWVGAKSAGVRAAFAQAKRQAPCVLFIDEVDSFAEARDGREDGMKEDRDLVNALLTLTSEIRRHQVILVAATNHMDRLDRAVVREGRFDFKIEIPPPDFPARLGLIRKGLRESAPGVVVQEGVLQSVAKRWNGFSVKRILAVTEELGERTRSQGLKSFEFQHFMSALRELQGQRGHVMEDVRPLEQLVFSSQTRDSLTHIIARMEDPEFTEAHGGSLPTGVLFSGPPGTGKTAACRALAHQLGWTFLPAVGADLARTPKQLDALFMKAKDLRPTVIFIDEADELIRARTHSASTEATNKLLTIMDGVGDRVSDVVWFAATNHPELVEPALLRGGRFSEKVVFELPTSEALATFIERWLRDKNVLLAPEVNPVGIAGALGHTNLASAQAILQAAVNHAVSRRRTPVLVGAADVDLAIRLVEVTGVA